MKHVVALGCYFGIWEFCVLSAFGTHIKIEIVVASCVLLDTSRFELVLLHIVSHQCGCVRRFKQWVDVTQVGLPKAGISEHV